MTTLSTDIINTYEARTQFSRLIDRVLSGEEVAIGRAGTPVAKLVPYVAPSEQEPRTGGDWKGRVFIRSDFEEPLDPEIQAAFEGSMP